MGVPYLQFVVFNQIKLKFGEYLFFSYNYEDIVSSYTNSYHFKHALCKIITTQTLPKTDNWILFFSTHILSQ